MGEYKINTYFDSIYEIEDFISDEDIRKIFQIIELGDSSNWGENGYKVYGNKDLIDLERKIVNSFDNVSRCVTIQDIKRLKPGQYLDKHTDKSYPDLFWGVIVYLNEDYTGGEIEYPDLDFRIKPKKRSMIVHSALHLHHVLPVKEGERYMITTFIFGDETTKLNII